VVTDRAADADLAPGPLRLVQSLANTKTETADHIGTRDEAVSWLHVAGILPADAVITGSEHGALQRLRDALRDMLAAHTGGRGDTDAAGRLTRGLADGRLVVTVDPTSSVGLASGARAPYSSVVAAIAAAIAESAAARTWRQLKTCTSAGCGTAFFDGSADKSAQRCAEHAG
jgi:predicted RNA-binding Zn ribbon-like protein